MVVIFNYARKRAEKTTPKREAPEMARIVPSLVVDVDDDDFGVEADPVAVELLDLVTIDEGVEEGVIVGRPAKRTELVNVWQFDEAGTLAV